MKQWYLYLVFFALVVNCSGDVMFVLAPSGVVLRSHADQKSERITTLPYKARVEKLAESRKREIYDTIVAPWVKIRAVAETGWVFGGYLSKRQSFLALYRSMTLKGETEIALYNSEKTRVKFAKNKDTLITELYLGEDTCHTYYTGIAWESAGQIKFVVRQSYGEAGFIENKGIGECKNMKNSDFLCKIDSLSLLKNDKILINCKSKKNLCRLVKERYCDSLIN